MKRYALPFAILLFMFAACKKEKNTTQVYDNGPTDSLKINQIQVIASHNSYHLKTNDSVFNWLVEAAAAGILPSEYDPKGIDYSHLPLEQQFDNYNVRGIELDIYYDPNGGNFYNRQGMRFVSQDVESHEEALKQPGFKIVHIPDFDFNTNYLTFKQALTAVYNWSTAHPNHLPIFINVETKDDDAPGNMINGLNLTTGVLFDATACDKLDEEIKSVFGEALDKVITPDKVKGSYSTLEAAALAGNWPQLAQARGKVVFAMQGSAESLYKAGHPSLQGRSMFVYSSPGKAEAAFVILNNPTGSKAQIQQRVAQGYIVRTRSDSDTKEARTGDYTDMNNAFESGAQIISTDYYKADPRAGTPGWTDFHVQFPNHELARINSFSAAGQVNLGTIKE